MGMEDDFAGGKAGGQSEFRVDCGISLVCEDMSVYQLARPPST